MRVVKWTLGILGVLAAAAIAFAARQEEGFFSPVFSPDGQYIYFVQRSTSGLIWGLGVEHFTPPAKARIKSDQFELCRIKSDGTAFEVLRRWPQSPLAGKTVENYRGRMFSYPHVALRFAGDDLEYEVGISIPKQPSSDTFVLRRRKGESHPAAWAKGYSGISTGDDVLHEPLEVLTAKGRESFPCAIVTYNDGTKQLQVRRKTPACDSIYPDGVQWTHVAEASRAADIRRIRKLSSLRREYIAKLQREGMTEIAAMLAADRRLADEGYYPKPPQLIARVVPVAGEPLFDIADIQFQVGLFNDIDEATANPGREVDKSSSPYLRHDHYPESGMVNSILSTGVKKFYVKRKGVIYEMTITERRPATR